MYSYAVECIMFYTGGRCLISLGCSGLITGCIVEQKKKKNTERIHEQYQSVSVSPHYEDAQDDAVHIHIHQSYTPVMKTNFSSFSSFRNSWNSSSKPQQLLVIALWQLFLHLQQLQIVTQIG